MMFSLPDFSVKRPVCVFICLVSLILFGVSSVFEMPLESHAGDEYAHHDHYDQLSRCLAG